ncbi:uncharacterized protein LOC144651508 isoform X2 [Oculina patagonica]
MGQHMSNILFRNQRRQITDLQRQLRAKDLVITSLGNQQHDLQVQVTVRDQRVADLERQVRAKDQRVTDLERQVRAKDQRVTDLERQVRAKDQRVADLQRQVRARQERARNQRVTDLQRQVRAKDQRLTDLEEQVRAKDQQVANLQRQLGTVRDRTHSSELENRHEIQHDWVINRNELMLMVDQLLGEGAWGRVVRGKFRRCNVAVKQIYEVLLSVHNRTVLEREVDIASRCRHPCLLQFIGATIDERPLIVMELMDRSLRSLYGEQQLTNREISVISLDVAQALNYLHQKKPDPIIHRDISSANVLLWRQGLQWRGKVSDYGTANFVRQCTRDDPGAPIYCAPEAISEAQDPISCKVDVYSFGVLLCEMYIRELPDPQRRDEQVRRVANERLRTRLIRPCMRLTPGTRPDMDEIITELGSS